MTFSLFEQLANLSPSPINSLLRSGTKFLGSILIFTLASQAQAANPVVPFMNLSADFGGDKMATLIYTNGDTQDIQGANGVLFGGGVIIPLLDSPQSPWATEIGANWKYSGMKKSTNADLSYTRFPIEALVFYHFQPQIRAGAGLTYHLNPSLKGTGAAANIDVTFKDALGTLAEVEYLTSNSLSFGLRYSNINYVEKTSGISSQAGGFGFSMKFFFDGGASETPSSQNKTL